MLLEAGTLLRTFSHLHFRNMLFNIGSFLQKKLHVLFMQSDGGLTPMDNFNGSRAVLSGPAGGVVRIL